MANKIDGIYFDAFDGQNFLLIQDGIYQVEHEHLTENGNVKIDKSKIEFEILQGDREGAPPCQIKIVETVNDSLNENLIAYLGGAFVSAVLITQDGQPFLNENGLFAKCENDGSLDID